MFTLLHVACVVTLALSDSMYIYLYCVGFGCACISFMTASRTDLAAAYRCAVSLSRPLWLPAVAMCLICIPTECRYPVLGY